jgi:hypothetical protein
MVDILASTKTLIEVGEESSEPPKPGDLYQYSSDSFYSGKCGLTDPNCTTGNNAYYSDVGLKTEEEDSGIYVTNLYMRIRVICSNIVDGKWKPEEEQEVTILVKEFGCEFLRKFVMYYYLLCKKY